MRSRRIRFALGLGATLAVVSGCAYESERTASPPMATVGASTPVVTTQTTTSPRVVTYREGRWELRGDGSTSSPYYWAWVPSGVVTATTPPPLPQPVLTGVTSSTPRVVTTSDGRWDLHGDGSTARPHIWVWTPRGATPPYPPLRYETPPTATMTPSLVTYREGSWELRGEGSNRYWVWVPAGVVMTTAAPPPLPQPVIASAPPQVVTTNEGRWQLYGDGTTARPYVWVWTPRGATPPSPPLPYDVR